MAEDLFDAAIDFVIESAGYVIAGIGVSSDSNDGK